MGTKTVKTCDVYGTTKGVKRYICTIAQIDESGEHVPLGAFAADLSERAVKRWLKFVKRGVPVQPKPWDEASTEDGHEEAASRS